MDVNAIIANFRRNITEHYFDMNGRVGRGEFWYYVLAYVVGALGVSLIASIVRLPLENLYSLALLLPSASIGARRLQDTGRNGVLVWAVIIAGFIANFIAFVAAANALMGGFAFFSFLFGFWAALVGAVLLVALVVLIVFWCQKGDPEPNRYGPPPYPFDPSTPVSVAP